ncbi:hypothetical protein F4821DRAFT_264480 [Hypoxylon rubiginosum]|uniref:Uncharacterized protein n=1 Tax=Hypoxylon rubiginosum TaxID=110542 RepID=A0ACC0CNC0_9PEZI|nr:hypothetical protein F4821DRAFT_264480 [Hypoxylon rubiginosum]
MKYLTVLSFFGAALPLVLAECCNSPRTGNCAGGHEPTPCCGKGSCNLFCCACKNGCWTAKIKNRYNLVPDLFERDADSAFAMADKSNNGTVSLEDYLEYMNVGQGDEQIWVTWFQKHDKNGDGLITVDEIRLE